MEDDRPEGNAEGTKQSRGGKARANRLSPEERKEIASHAATARWSRITSADGTIYKAVATGDNLRIGEAVLQCAVLDDPLNTRVLTQSGFLKALGRFPTPPSAGNEVLANLPAFLRAKNLEPFISNELISSSTPMIYEAKGGGGRAGRSLGFKAQLLPQVCWVYHNAMIAKKLTKSQEHIATKCKILLEGLTNVAIDALVDEATGYQYIREQDELQRLLAAYVSPFLLPVKEKIPIDFFKGMFKVWDWPWPATATSYKGPPGPRYGGKLIRQLILENLPEAVLEELDKKNPANGKWQRRYRMREFLTSEIGRPHVDKLISNITMLFNMSDNKTEFWRNYQKAFKKEPPQIEMKFGDDTP